MLRSKYQQLGQKDTKEELSLLEKKDQQIRRLQAQLEQEKRRADNSVKMLQNFKSIQLKSEEGGDTLRTQINRRLKAQQQLLKVQQKNNYLQEGIRKYIDQLKRSKKDEKSQRESAIQQ